MELSTKRYNRYQKEKKTLLGSFKHAYDGMKYSYIAENHIKIHITLALFAIIFGVIFKINYLEWALLLLTIFLVIAFELFNTAIEVIVDMLEPKENPLAKVTKDAAAGAVLLVSLGALLVGIFIFVPKILDIVGVAL